ncbi:uncharacterized protein LOC106463536 [Limulus polyphemus]|uniref:Uncharacterized protein LOC106463536 n=1 Tax=Limulus polyphemus TaxID=6850 RepID=A0ABM1BC53_LIMPO|nr:uncharacterized protein LOC106463536 [Limulus polyphemus]
MGLRIIFFCALVALRTNMRVALAGIPLYYDVLPHVQYSQPLGPLTAPALESPVFVQGTSPLSFTYTAGAEGGFSSRSESESAAGEVTRSYSLNIPGGRQREVNYKAGRSGFTGEVRSNEQGINAGENPANVQILALGLGAPISSEAQRVSPAVPFGEPRKPLSYTYSAGAKTGDVSGNVAESSSVDKKKTNEHYRNVDYSAGSGGFKANVHSNEPGVLSGNNPADININHFTVGVVPSSNPANVNINHFPAGVVPSNNPANINNNLFPGVPSIPTGAYGTGDEHIPVKSIGPFSFTYTADVEGGTNSRTEGGDGSGNVAGSYSVADPDGRRRTVKYIAGAGGFMADIQSNEPGVEPDSNPANVKISSFPGAPVIPTGSSTAAGATALAAELSPFNFTYTAVANERSVSRSESGDVAGDIVGSYSVTHADGTKRAVDYATGAQSFRPSIQSNGKGLGDNPANTKNLAFAGAIGSPRAVIPVSAATPLTAFVPHPISTREFFEIAKYAPASESKIPNYSWYR